MARFAWSLLAAASTQAAITVEKYSITGDSFAVSGEDYVAKAIELCGEMSAPDNSRWNCMFNKTDDEYSCEMSCKSGFILDDSAVHHNIVCKDNEWVHSETLDSDLVETPVNAPYAKENYSCQRETLCRQTAGARCTASGAFECVQCDTETNECWCVNELGAEIADTRVGEGFDTPNCVGYAAAPVKSPKLPAHYDWHDACVVWEAGTWFKTFDGNFFGYTAPSCQMTLLETPRGFSVYQFALDNEGRVSYELHHEEQKVAARLTYNADGLTTLYFAGREYALDESKESVTLGGVFKVHRESGAVVVVDQIEHITVVFNGEALLIRSKYNQASNGVCGSFDANAKNDIKNTYGHVVENISDSVDTWRSSCPTQPYWVSAATGTAGVTVFKNSLAYPVTLLVKRIESDGTKKSHR